MKRAFIGGVLVGMLLSGSVASAAGAFVLGRGYLGEVGLSYGAIGIVEVEPGIHCYYRTNASYALDCLKVDAP